MTEGRFGKSAAFDGMSWPLATDEAIGDIQYKLRYPDLCSPLTKTEMMVAATVLSAYSQMVYDPERKRRHVIRKLREIGAMPDRNAKREDATS